jgi:hypothetical protein
MSRRRHAEDGVQRAVCEHLQIRGARNLVWWHTPNGGKRWPFEAAILKGLGVRAGVADLVLLHAGRMFALELKADGGRPTEAQRQFIDDFRAAGGHAVVAEGLDEALRTLEAWKHEARLRIVRRSRLRTESILRRRCALNLPTR